jgi:hypothetical protein
VFHHVAIEANRGSTPLPQAERRTRRVATWLTKSPSVGYETLGWASVQECHPTLNYAFDDGAESVLTGECPFDSRDDVQERDYPGNLEDSFGDRHTPQYDIELATEFNGVFLRP